MAITKANRAILADYALNRMSGQRYRIARNGEVHIFGRMPNSIVTGWWFADFADNILDKMQPWTDSAAYAKAQTS